MVNDSEIVEFCTEKITSIRPEADNCWIDRCRGMGEITQCKSLGELNLALAISLHLHLCPMSVGDWWIYQYYWNLLHKCNMSDTNLPLSTKSNQNAANNACCISNNLLKFELNNGQLNMKWVSA